MAKIIFQVFVVDMDEKVMDVVGVMHLVADSPEDAVNKAAAGFTEQKITKEGGKYHFHLVGIAPIPGGPQIIQPKIQLPKGALSVSR